MALRQEDLRGSSAEILAFPTAVVRRRAERQMQATFLRRRLTVASALLVLAAGLGVIVGGAPEPVLSAPGAPKAVRIQAGDTIWGLASTYAPDADPRAFVDEVMRLNGLSGAPEIGTKIRLPRG